jgi:hypothetical protein
VILPEAALFEVEYREIAKGELSSAYKVIITEPMPASSRSAVRARPSPSPLTAPRKVARRTAGSRLP